MGQRPSRQGWENRSTVLEDAVGNSRWPLPLKVAVKDLTTACKDDNLYARVGPAIALGSIGRPAARRLL